MNKDTPADVFANGVRYKGVFYPFVQVQRVAAVAPGASATLTPNLNQALFVSKVLLSVRMIAADTTTEVWLEGTLNGDDVLLCDVGIVPSVAGQVFQQFDCNLLLDKGTSLLCYCDAEPTLGSANILYTEVYP